jgi:isoquinoline 1-oxidoreductase beta subunit
MHLVNGSFLEGSWDNYFYTRQWNVPPELQVILLPGDPSAEVPGSEEAGVAASMAAVAGAFVAATRTTPTILPVNHNTLSFTPYPLEPSTPPSPDTGLQSGF